MSLHIIKYFYYLGLAAPSSTNKIETKEESTEASSSLRINIPPKRRKLQNLPFGDIVLVERPGDTPQNILACAINAAGANMDCKFDKTNDFWYVPFASYL